MTKYSISFFPRAACSEHRVSDVSTIVIGADSKEEAVEIFVKKAKTEIDIRVFIISFLLGLGENIGTPFKDQKNLEKTFKKLQRQVEKAGIPDMDPEVDESYAFIKKNRVELTYLINAYIVADCDFISIAEYRQGKCI